MELPGWRLPNLDVGTSLRGPVVHLRMRRHFIRQRTFARASLPRWLALSLQGMRLMYEPFFGLSSRPFAAAPDADCYFPATAIETARQTLFRSIDRGEGRGAVDRSRRDGQVAVVASSGRTIRRAVRNRNRSQADG